MRIDVGLLLVFLGVLLLLTVAMVLPFLQYFLMAVLLAYVLTPAQEWLATRRNQQQAAALLVLAATVTVILPFALVVRTTVTQSLRLFRRIQEGEITFTTVEEWIQQVLGLDVEVAELVRSAVSDVGTGALDSVFGLFGFLTHALVGLGLTVFLLFYFLKDGDRLWGWLHRRVPLPGRVQETLYERVDAIMAGVLAGHVLVAIVQGVIAGLGLLAFGIPNALFWTVVMAVLSLLPIVGSFLVWGPAVAYLAITGEPVSALLLFVYGTVVVGITDDYLRPVVMNRYAAVNPSALIIGILGGVYVIGFMGIFFGPVIIGSLRAALEVYHEEYWSAPVGRGGD